MNFTITIAPEGNWHLYNFSGNETSYHQTRLVGAVEQEAPDGLIDGLNEEIGLFVQEAGTAGEVYLKENDFAFGSGAGVSVTKVQAPQWQNSGIVPEISADAFNVKYGSSAGAPLILKGAPVTFTANFSFGVDYPEGGRNAVARAISLIISPGPGTGPTRWRRGRL